MRAWLPTCCLLAGLAWTCTDVESPPGPSKPVADATTVTAGHVGSSRCATCHAKESEAWHASHHDHALQQVSDDAVLAPFEGGTLDHDGVTWRFLREGSRYLVESDESGEVVQHEVALVFGVEPLQQYLVAFDGGRLQALPTAWDTRPAEEGGQRWFHLYPDEHIPVGDELHWQGINQTWNSMCAECHSTDLVRGFEVETGTFATHDQGEDVGCEACHGPGSEHVAWAEEQAKGGTRPVPPGAFLRDGLADRDGGRWVTNASTGLPVRIPARDNRPEVETCAKCHSRRRPLTDGTGPATAFLDAYEPSLLSGGLYHADGQIDDEVYVWGSFAQSRMHAAGVSCRDCHDPHSLELRHPGNGTCTQCHDQGTFDTVEHHHHPAGGPGARCVDCHMAEKHYMVVDGRRDHSFRVPRPDLAAKLGLPDACSACHDQGSDWIVSAFEDWTKGKDLRPSFAPVFAAARRRDPSASAGLVQWAQSEEAPALVRATAVDELGELLTPAELPVLAALAHDPEPLVRAATARSAEALPPEHRTALLGHLLIDPVRAVRVAAARALAGAGTLGLDPRAQEGRARAFQEARNAERVNGERAEAWVNLSVLEMDEGNLAAAEKHLRRALLMAPGHVPATVNLADILRQGRREEEARAVLNEGLALHRNSPDLHQSLGMAWIRAGEPSKAEEHFAQAAAWGPLDPRNPLMHGLCLVELDRFEEAITAYGAGLSTHGAEPSLVEAAVEALRRLESAGQLERAAPLAAQLLALAPSQPEFVTWGERLGVR